MIDDFRERGRPRSISGESSVPFVVSVPSSPKGTRVEKMAEDKGISLSERAFISLFDLTFFLSSTGETLCVGLGL